MMNRLLPLALVLLLAFAAFAQAGDDNVRVALVVDFDDGTVYKECVTVEKGSDAYEVMKASGLNIKWSFYLGYGYFLDSINGVANDFFVTGKFWNLYHTPDRDSEWSFASSGVNYLKYDQDGKLGWVFTTWNTKKPPEVDFKDVCENPSTGPRQKKILMSSRPFWRAYCAACGIEYDEYVPPQNLVKACEEKKASGVDDEPPKEILFDYWPAVITDLDKPVRLIFSTEDGPLVGTLVDINGKYYVTDLNGEIWMQIEKGDHVIEIKRDGYAEFKRIFRVG